MKISKKVIVSSLATVMGLSLVGAVTGTVAWYQYSTRSTVSFMGTSIRMSERMQIRQWDPTANEGAGAYGDWKEDLVLSTTSLTPVTPRATANIAAAAGATNLPSKFNAHPVYQFFDSTVDAKTTSYLSAKFQLRIQDVDGKATRGELAGQSIWLNDLTILGDGSASSKLAKGIRVHLHTNNSTGQNYLFAAEAKSTVLGGKLDLNGDGLFDASNKYAWESRVETEYGNKTYSETTTLASALYPTDTNTDGKLTGGTPLYTTVDNSGATPGEEVYLTIELTAWLEGWDLSDPQAIRGYSVVSPAPAENASVSGKYKFDGTEYVACGAEEKAATGVTYYTQDAQDTNVPMWDDQNYVGKQVNIGLQFACSTLSVDRA